jgi:hypothetical protein
VDLPAPEAVMWGAGAPLAVAVLAWGVWRGWRGWRAVGGDGVGKWYSDLPLAALPGGFAAGYFAFATRGKFPPLDATEWVFYGALAMVVLLAVEGVARPGRWGWKGLLWAVGVGVLVVPVSTAWRDLPDLEGGLRLAPGLAWAAVAGWMLAGVAHRASAGWLGCRFPLATVLVLGLTSALGAVLMGFSGSQFSMPFRMAAVGLGLLPALPLMLLRRDLPMPAVALTMWSVLHGALLLVGYLYFQLTAVSCGLLLIGPALACLVPVGGRGWKRLVLVVVAGVLPSAVGIGIELPAMIRSFSQPSDGY